MPQKSYSPERFLAISAGAHELVKHLPQSAYPLRNWEAVADAVGSLRDLDLRAPGGAIIDAEAARDAVRAIQKRGTADFFPVADSDDLAHKAGLVLVSLVLAYHAPRMQRSYCSPDFEEEVSRMKSTFGTGDGT